jgi:hypothetical protein
MSSTSINHRGSRMARQAGPAGADLLIEVERLAGEGYGKGEIAERLGFKSPTTFDARLVKASQRTGKPIPAFGGHATRSRTTVDRVPVKARGGDRAFGAYLPQEPLERLGAKPGDTLTVNVSRRRIVLEVENEKDAAEAGPRLVKGRKGC